MSEYRTLNEFEKLCARIFGKAFIHEKDRKIASEKFRVFSRWYFETVRNILVVASVQFLAKKSGSKPVLFVALLSGWILVFHAQSYIDPYLIWPKNIFKLQWLNIASALLINLLIFLPLIFVITIYVPSLIDTIAQGYLSQSK